MIAPGHQCYDAAFPGLDLLNVTDRLFVDAVGRGDGDNRHLLVDQGNGSVLHFGGRIPLGMDVGDLLEFQSSFQSHGIVISPPQVDEIAGIGKYLRELADRGVELEGLLHALGNGSQFAEQFSVELRVDAVLQFGDRQGQHREYGYLSGERFGRSHTDLRTHMDV